MPLIFIGKISLAAVIVSENRVSQRSLVAHVPVPVLTVRSALVNVNVFLKPSLELLRLVLVPLKQRAVLVVVDVRRDALIAGMSWPSIIQSGVLFGIMRIAKSIALVDDVSVLRVADVFALHHADVVVGQVILVVWHDV